MYVSYGKEHLHALNFALLDRTDQPTISHIELATRYTSTVWSAIRDKEVKLPPQAKWPAGVKPPKMPGAAPQASDGTSDATSGRKPQEILDPEVRMNFRECYVLACLTSS